jgi:gamma-glutamyltranspeptidase/glutathione hydrolase
MVASADHLASSAGVSLLRDGGTAVDAALAAAAVLAVTSPHMCGMGGDLFAVVHPPGEPVAALCAAGRAGSGADPLQLRVEGYDDHVPLHGDIRAVTVPGCVDGWLELHRRFGRLPLSQVFEPAVTYAAAGFPASPLLAGIVSEIVHLHGAHDFREPTMATGGHLQPGTLIRRPGIATTLGAIATSGRAALYQGSFGDGLLLLGAGLYNRGDLARPQAEWVEPLHVTVWGHDLWTVPPPSQGYLTLAGAAVAAELGLPDDPTDPLWAHLLSEAARAVARDRPDVLYDGADGPALLDPERLAGQRAGIDPDRRGEAAVAAVPGDTTALCAVDRERMAVSLIQSNASAWGARIIEPSIGEFLHNRAIGFTLQAGHKAEYQPGRRPPHSLSPLLVTRPDGSMRAALGTMGGDAQPQYLLQLVTRLLHGADATAAAIVHAPRWRLGGGGFGIWGGDGPAQIHLEHDAPPAWSDGLAERGHDVVRSRFTPDHGFGHAQLITVEGDTLHGAADPRTMVGAAAGY